MKPRKEEKKDALLEELYHMAQEVEVERSIRVVRTYSRVKGKLRVNVAPEYPKSLHPFFALVSQIKLDPDMKVDAEGKQIIRTLDRACTSLKERG